MAENVTDLGIKNYVLLQDAGCGFSQDSVFLANMATIKPFDKVLDLGCGSGILSHLVVIKKGAEKAVGVDIQQRLVDMATRSAKLNGLCDKLSFICGDVKDIKGILPAESFDKVVCNPPYFCGNQNTAQSDNNSRFLSRQENSARLADFLRAAAYSLRFGGDLFISIKPDRLAELICGLKSVDLEPKKLTLIYPKLSKGVDAVIVAARKGARSGLAIATFIAMNEDGSYTAEYNRLYAE